jgi:hypothetical protein
MILALKLKVVISKGTSKDGTRKILHRTEKRRKINQEFPKAVVKYNLM